MDDAAAIVADIDRLASRDTPSVRAVRRRWSAALKARPATDVLAIARALEAAQGQGGKWVAYEIIRFHAAAFAKVSQAEIADYASRVASWGAVDALGTILAGPLWAKGRIADALPEAWSRAESRWLRRLSLVSTIRLNARGSAGDAPRTLALCRRLAGDRDDMVEKALSWALRELLARDRAAVEAFVAETGERLPARVRREVRNKLSTGLKTPRNRRMVTGA